VVLTMTTVHGAGSGARNPNLPINRSNEMHLIYEALARAHCHDDRYLQRQAERERQLTQQLVVARAHRSARWAERFAAFAERRAQSRRSRANMLAAGLR